MWEETKWCDTRASSLCNEQSGKNPIKRQTLKKWVMNAGNPTNTVVQETPRLSKISAFVTAFFVLSDGMVVPGRWAGFFLDFFPPTSSSNASCPHLVRVQLKLVVCVENREKGQSSHRGNQGDNQDNQKCHPSKAGFRKALARIPPPSPRWGMGSTPV